MLTEERFRVILDMLGKNDTVTVAELTRQLGASESTVRRDLNTLQRQGMLIKVHGGAAALGSALTHENDISDDTDLRELRSAAIYAAGLIENGDVVFLDSGSAAAFMPDYVRAQKAMFVTNSLAQAQALTEKGFDTVVLGGRVQPASQTVTGEYAADMLRRFNFAKGFFNADGISINAGYSTGSLEESAIKSAAIKRCQNSYILSDSPKFDKTAPISFAALEDAVIITSGSRKTQSAYAEHTMIIEVKKL